MCQVVRNPDCVINAVATICVEHLDAGGETFWLGAQDQDRTALSLCSLKRFDVPSNVSRTNQLFEQAAEFGADPLELFVVQGR